MQNLKRKFKQEKNAKKIGQSSADVVKNEIQMVKFHSY